MTRVALVACCGPKLSHPAPARDLYTSTLFRKAAAVAEADFDQWFILSALHGLVEPDAVISPYNVTLGREETVWGWRVWEALRNLDILDAEFTVFAGARYTGPLLDTGLKLVQPMKGKGIGQQLQHLTRV